MNYTVTISISCLLASQKILKFRISVGSSEVLVRPSNLHPCFFPPPRSSSVWFLPPALLPRLDTILSASIYASLLPRRRSTTSVDSLLALLQVTSSLAKWGEDIPPIGNENHEQSGNPEIIHGRDCQALEEKEVASDTASQLHRPSEKASGGQ